MAILIEGMEMPKEGYKVIYVHSNGSVYQPSNAENIWHKIASTVPVPAHGRLIDESEFFARLDDGIKTISSLSLPEDFVALYTQLAKEVKEEIGKCRTIIPAEEG